MELAIKLASNLIPVALGIFALVSWRKVSRERKERLAALGIAPVRLDELAYGALLGFLAFALIFPGAHSMGWISIADAGFPTHTAFATLAMFLAFAIGEEFVFRSLCFAGLKRLNVPLPAILIGSSVSATS